MKIYLKKMNCKKSTFCYYSITITFIEMKRDLELLRFIFIKCVSYDNSSYWNNKAFVSLIYFEFRHFICFLYVLQCGLWTCKVMKTWKSQCAIKILLHKNFFKHALQENGLAHVWLVRICFRNTFESFLLNFYIYITRMF